MWASSERIMSIRLSIISAAYVYKYICIAYGHDIIWMDVALNPQSYSKDCRDQYNISENVPFVHSAKFVSY